MAALELEQASVTLLPSAFTLGTHLIRQERGRERDGEKSERNQGLYESEGEVLEEMASLSGLWMPPEPCDVKSTVYICSVQLQFTTPDTQIPILLRSEAPIFGPPASEVTSLLLFIHISFFRLVFMSPTCFSLFFPCNSRTRE